MSVGLKLDDGKYLLVGSFMDRNNPTSIVVVTDKDGIHKLILQYDWMYRYKVTSHRISLL